jgi:acylphosphatase
MKKAMRLHLTGLLTSMFFKQFVKQQAEQFQIKGFMRKRPDDGRIEIFIQGEDASVDAMLAACKQGPKYAKIYKVEEQTERWQDDIKEFKLL